jgi:putative ABC transport system substrate-binding protein
VTAARIGLLAYPAIPHGWVEPLLPQEPLRQALRDLGYLDGQNLAWVAFAATREDLLPRLAGDLLTLEVDLILALGTEAIRAARQATPIVPIVMLSPLDPVEMGFVASLTRPGRNVTGVSLEAARLAARRLELVREAVPGASRVAVLWNPADAGAAAEWEGLRASASRLGLVLIPAECRSPEAIEAAFAAMGAARAGALVVALDPLTYMEGSRIVRLAAEWRLPAIYGSRLFVEQGGLMAYQAAARDVARRLAAFLDRILKGAWPGALPVERPTEFELVVNLKAAGALGLRLPRTFLAGADEVIR